MNRSSTVAMAALLLLAGCAGTPKLARCTGPYRYANPYGTVLPTLPIPGQSATAGPNAPAPVSAVSPPVSRSTSGPDRPAPPPVPATEHSDPGKTSGLAPAYPSC